MLEQRLTGENGLRRLLGRAGTANVKLIYQQFLDLFDGTGFAELHAKGGVAQRPLWASTGTKNPTYPDLKYVEPIVGPMTINTILRRDLHRCSSAQRSGRTQFAKGSALPDQPSLDSLRQVFP